MDSIISTVVVGSIGAIIGYTATYLISIKRNQFELALATWNERAEAHRKINSTLTRFIALLDVGEADQSHRDEVKKAFETFREYNIFLDRILRDEIHDGLKTARSVIIEKTEPGSNDDRALLDSLRNKLRDSAGVDRSSRVLMSYFGGRSILNLLSKGIQQT